MADANAAAPKPSSSVKLVLLGEAAVGKVCTTFPVKDLNLRMSIASPTTPEQGLGTQLANLGSPCGWRGRNGDSLRSPPISVWGARVPDNDSYRASADAASDLVISRSTIREQRLPGEQGANHRR